MNKFSKLWRDNMSNINELIQDLEDVAILKEATTIIGMCDILINNKNKCTIKGDNNEIFISIDTAKFYGSLIISDKYIKVDILKRASSTNSLDRNSISAFIIYNVLKEISGSVYNSLINRVNKIKSMV